MGIWVFTLDAVVGIPSGSIHVTILSVHTPKAPTSRLSQSLCVFAGVETRLLPILLTVQAVMFQRIWTLDWTRDSLRLWIVSYPGVEEGSTSETVV